MTAGSPAERLRSAADLIEQRAVDADPGPWHPDHPYGRPDRVKGVWVDCGAEDGSDGVDCYDGTHGIGGFDRDPDNRWSILLGPQVAAPLAAWLREAADHCAHAFDQLTADPGPLVADILPAKTPQEAAQHVERWWARPLALADLILGGDR